MSRFFSTALLAVALILAACASPETAPREEVVQASSRAFGSGTAVHLFEWRWQDVAQECEQHLGPTGYTAVQVSSPIENHIVEGRPWWERYQPVSYQLETRSGSREEFAEMVSRCRAAGVEVMVDAVINHMTDADLEHDEVTFTGRGTAGTEFSSYNYPGLYGFDDFHHCGLTENDDIERWNDRAQLEDCELVDLADLKTESEKVRGTIAAYLRDLASLDVRELRIDAALHTATEDLQAILDLAEWDGYVVQEVSQSAAAARYLAGGAVTDFAYGETLSEGFREGSLPELLSRPFWSESGMDSETAFVFVDNHDKQRHGVYTLSYKDEAYPMAVAFMLATPYGRARVMSSFVFDDAGIGPPADDDEAILPIHGEGGIGCGDAWVCEHRWPVIAGMVGFRAATDGEDVTRVQEGGADRVAFTRGDRGWVAFNRSAEPWELVHQTGLPGTSYCNVAEGPVLDGACADGSVRVDAGMVSAVVPPMGVVAIHVDAQN